MEEPKEPEPLTEFESNLHRFAGIVPLRWQLYYLKLKQYLDKSES